MSAAKVANPIICRGTSDRAVPHPSTAVGPNRRLGLRSHATATAREPDTMIDLHYWPTPNGKKVTILLEEAAIPYNIVPVHIGRGDQFTPAFLKMNPNHRMPVVVDTAPAGGGELIVIFESGAIMLYLAEKVGR